VDLCGHATLASAYVLYHILGYKKDQIEFDSKSGILTVSRDNDWLVMNFPAQPPVPCDIPEEIVNAFNTVPVECLISEDYIVVFENETDIESAEPDFEQLKKLDLRGVAITAKATRYDFVARFFAPNYGIPEDPVTGSAYTQLAPYWASKTGRRRFSAKQLSPRGGELICEVVDDRVFISGKAVQYMEGKIKAR
jgi:PhzF family phenazine biosynthesis protein